MKLRANEMVARWAVFAITLEAQLSDFLFCDEALWAWTVAFVFEQEHEHPGWPWVICGHTISQYLSWCLVAGKLVKVYMPSGDMNESSAMHGTNWLCCQGRHKSAIGVRYQIVPGAPRDMVQWIEIDLLVGLMKHCCRVHVQINPLTGGAWVPWRGPPGLKGSVDLGLPMFVPCHWSSGLCPLGFATSQLHFVAIPLAQGGHIDQLGQTQGEIPLPPDGQSLALSTHPRTYWGMLKSACWGTLRVKKACALVHICAPSIRQPGKVLEGQLAIRIMGWPVPVPPKNPKHIRWCLHLLTNKQPDLGEQLPPRPWTAILQIAAAVSGKGV
ncbi:hypothetical protein K439DRAFT_1618225 [Ramaria rubella]|nr:hypothetical protein K439DRAFT_1618225 [Ramaria rubella]